RPFEGWTHEDIMKKLGPINYYVHDKVGVPLLVTDDDLSGTFTFLRALEDYSYSNDITSAQIGQTWLNYIVEERSILWWGGLGNSTEHTAFLRLKQGIKAPDSGSERLNSKIVAEQIGAQIFIDGWAMVTPGNPVQAAEFAKQASQVSHDGEAVYAAQLLAAMEAQAFIESDIDKLLDTGLSFIPATSIIYQLVQDIRNWHKTEPDWRIARELIEKKYGYHIYGGNCHVVPNHALIIMALLYGQGDFHKSLMIVNTCGWDTDCNSGNLGCLLGIRGGLACLDGGPDWLGPLADKLYIPTADGGRAITDAVIETYHIVKAAHALDKKTFYPPKDGARLHFSLPGSKQGFTIGSADPISKHELINTNNPKNPEERCLCLHYQKLIKGEHVWVSSTTFIPPEAINMIGSYVFIASPSLYSGQVLSATFITDKQNKAPVSAALFVRYYGEDDQLETVTSEAIILKPD